MERIAYRFLEKAEKSWWYHGRRYAVTLALKRAGNLPQGKVLDFGAGRGAACTMLRAYGSVDAYEIDQESAEACRARGYEKVFTDMPPVENQYAFVSALDVVEHIEDDAGAVLGLYERMQKGGLLVVTVPAFMWLWSAHDKTHMHFRRYDKKSMTELLTRAGFTVEYVTYWNMTLTPMAYLMRKVGAGGGALLTPSPVVDALLTALVWLESRLMYFTSLPFGISFVAVARK